ncbi:MAG: DUF1289 domain-containing protein [Planctomycetia bacterium]|nr:DUF1289 domain-containing protein [Planctomycetia bacterium]
MTIRSHQPDSPCLGFCTTALGDDVCKSCGRSFEEVTSWIVMSPEAKAVTWERLNRDGWWKAQQSASGTSGADRRARNGG